MPTKMLVILCSCFIVYSIIASLTLIPLFAPLVSNNFHTLEEKQAYRSAQLESSELERIVKTYQIKTIVNLCGVDQNRWWHKEHDIAHDYGLHFVNIPLRATRQPATDQLRKLLATFKLPRPILFHCRHGRDRTGLAAALWAYEEMKHPKEKALLQLSYDPYGHMAWLYPEMRKTAKTWISLRESGRSPEDALVLYEQKHTNTPVDPAVI